MITGTPAKAAQWKAEFGLPDKNSYSYDQLDQLANNPDIDLVYITLPNGLLANADRARALLAEGSGIGRRFDFLVQEFVRETNTLCSKSASIPLTATGLQLKAVIEQMREQVQNVE